MPQSLAQPPPTLVGMPPLPIPPEPAVPPLPPPPLAPVPPVPPLPATPPEPPFDVVVVLLVVVLDTTRGEVPLSSMLQLAASTNPQAAAQGTSKYGRYEGMGECK